MSSQRLPASNAMNVDRQDSDPCLSDMHRRLYNTPPAGEWFFRQSPALTLHSMSGRTGFPVAWDKAVGTQKKVYGVYDDAETYYTHARTLPPKLRAGYEIILPDHPARGYARVEFITEEPDAHHTRMAAVLAHYRQKALEQYNLSAEIYVAYSSRPEKGRVRSVYHVTIHNLVFANNHDGVMKHFFSTADIFDPL